MNKKGELSIYITIISIVFIFIIIIEFSIVALFVNVYAVVYDYKLDLYNLNRNAIISVNKINGSYGIYEYQKSEYLKYFKDILIKTYNLDSNLKNGDKFIKQIEIVEYVIYNIGDIDSITNNKITSNTIHVVTKITFNPIVYKFLFKDGCTFKLHNDVSIKIYDI